MSDDENERSDGARRRKGKTSKMSAWFTDTIFVCCCQGFLNPNGTGSKEYYEVLLF